MPNIGSVPAARSPPASLRVAGALLVVAGIVLGVRQPRHLQAGGPSPSARPLSARRTRASPATWRSASPTRRSRTSATSWPTGPCWWARRGRSSRSEPFRAALPPRGGQGAHALALLEGAETRRPLGPRPRRARSNSALLTRDPQLAARLPRAGAGPARRRRRAARSARARCAPARWPPPPPPPRWPVVLGAAPPAASVCDAARPPARAARSPARARGRGDRPVLAPPARSAAALGPHRRARRSGSRRAASGTRSRRAALLGPRARRDGRRPRLGGVLVREPRRGRADRAPRAGTGCTSPRPAAASCVRALALARASASSRLCGPTATLRLHGGRSAPPSRSRGCASCSCSSRPASTKRPTRAQDALAGARTERRRGRAWLRYGARRRSSSLGADRAPASSSCAAPRPCRSWPPRSPTPATATGAVRPPARRGRLPRRPQLDVGGGVRGLDVPEPGAGIGLAPAATASARCSSTCTTASRSAGRVKTEIEDEAGSRAKFEKALGQGGRRRGDAHPRPPHRPARRARGPPTSATASASSARGRSSRCSRASGTSSSRTRARSLVFVIEDYVHAGGRRRRVRARAGSSDSSTGPGGAAVADPAAR